MSRSSMTLSIATWMRSARSGSSLIATMPRWLRGMRPKWIVSGSPSRRPSATRIGSTSPMRSATLVSGVASFSAYRSSRCRHSTGRSSPSSAARRRDSTVIGSNGCSPSSDPARTGDHSSSRPTRLRRRRVLPWPRSPSSTTSWPASRARSSWGMTVEPKPCRPGHGSRPAASAASRLSRISARTDRASCPVARSSPTVVGAGRSLIASRYVRTPTAGTRRQRRRRCLPLRAPRATHDPRHGRASLRHDL